MTEQEHSSAVASNHSTASEGAARIPWKLLAPLLLTTALFLLPMLDSGYQTDDGMNSLTPGYDALTHRGPTGMARDMINGMLTGNARFYPLASYAYFIFFWLRNIYVYKAYLIVAVLIATLCLFCFLRRLTRSDGPAVMACFLLPLFYQFRIDGWDPVSALNGMMPFFTAILFLSLFALVKFLDSDPGGRKWLVLSVFLYIVLELYYDIAYPLFVAYLALTYFRSRKRESIIRATWPYAAVGAAFFAFSFVLHRSVKMSEQNAYNPSLAPFTVLKALAVQMIGAVPYTYWIFDPHALFKNAGFAQSTAELGFLVLAAALAGMLARGPMLALQRMLPANAARLRLRESLPPLVIASCLAPALICLSPRYQQIPLGIAYTPSFVTMYCYAGILGIALYWLTQKLGRFHAPAYAPVVLITLWCFGFLFGMRNNILAARASDERMSDARQVLQAACRAGLLQSAPAEALVFVEGRDFYNWNNANFYAQYCHKAVRIVHVDEQQDYRGLLQSSGAKCVDSAGVASCTMSGSPVLFVKTRFMGRGFGFAVASRVSQAVCTREKLLGLLGFDAEVFYQLPTYVVSPPSVGVSVRETKAGPNGNDLLLDESGLTQTRAGRGWKIAELHHDKLFDAFALNGVLLGSDSWFFLYPHGNVSTYAISAPSSSFRIRTSGREILHLAYSGGQFGKGMPVPSLRVNRDTVIEILITPDRTQAEWATILDDRDPNEVAGLAIEQVGGQTNRYQIVMGAKGRWSTAGPFTLQAGCTHHLVLQLAGPRPQFLVDDDPIAGTVDLSGLSGGSGGVLGNSAAGGREFHGLINEIAVYEGARSENRVAAGARSSRSTPSCLGTGTAELSRSSLTTSLYWDNVGGVRDPSKHPVVQILAGRFTAAGWAVDTPNQTSAAAIEVVIDGKPYQAQYGIDRPDVASALNNSAYRKSGFELTLPRIEKGDHTISLRVIAKTGDVYYESPPLQLRAH